MGFHKSYCTPPVTEVIPQTLNMAYLLTFTLEINQTSLGKYTIVPLSVWAQGRSMAHLQPQKSPRLLPFVTFWFPYSWRSQKPLRRSLRRTNISKASSIRDLLISPSWRSQKPLRRSLRRTNISKASSIRDLLISPSWRSQKPLRRSQIKPPKMVTDKTRKNLVLSPFRLPFCFPITVPLGIIDAEGIYLVNPDKGLLGRVKVRELPHPKIQGCPKKGIRSILYLGGNGFRSINFFREGFGFLGLLYK